MAEVAANVFWHGLYSYCTKPEASGSSDYLSWAATKRVFSLLIDPIIVCLINHLVCYVSVRVSSVHG